MQNSQIAAGALLVAAIAGLALYSSLEDSGPPDLPPDTETAPPAASAPRPATPQRDPGRPATPPLGAAGPGTPPAGPGAPDSPGTGSESAVAASARRLLELLPGDDCAEIVRFADSEADRRRRDPGAQPLVNALEAAQQYCYQRERLPDVAREQRAEAERLASGLLGEAPAPR